VGQPGGKRSGLSPKKQENFLFIEIKFKQVQTLFNKRWTYEARKIPNKIWLESLDMRNNYAYRNFLRFLMSFELKFRKFSMS
jgi:hypothetical protein